MSADLDEAQAEGGWTTAATASKQKRYPIGHVLGTKSVELA
jgi:hypothetical protein